MGFLLIFLLKINTNFVFYRKSKTGSQIVENVRLTQSSIRVKILVLSGFLQAHDSAVTLRSCSGKQTESGLVVASDQHRRRL